MFGIYPLFGNIERVYGLGWMSQRTLHFRTEWDTLFSYCLAVLPLSLEVLLYTAVRVPGSGIPYCLDGTVIPTL